MWQRKWGEGIHKLIELHIIPSVFLLLTASMLTVTSPFHNRCVVTGDMFSMYY